LPGGSTLGGRTAAFLQVRTSGLLGLVACEASKLLAAPAKPPKKGVAEAPAAAAKSA
jgi:hypothetical protein